MYDPVYLVFRADEMEYLGALLLGSGAPVRGPVATLW